jgi:hypothetical protein
MMIIEKPNPGQMEREKTGSDEEESEGDWAQRVHREFAYHAAQFHDQTGFINRNHANALCGPFPSFARASEGEPHAKRVRVAHPGSREACRGRDALRRGDSDFAPEELDGPGQPLGQRDFRSPTKNLSGPRNIRPALPGIILRQGPEGDPAARLSCADDFLSELQHGHFHRVAYIHRLIIPTHHEPVDPFN